MTPITQVVSCLDRLRPRRAARRQGTRGDARLHHADQRHGKLADPPSARSRAGAGDRAADRRAGTRQLSDGRLGGALRRPRRAARRDRHALAGKPFRGSVGAGRMRAHHDRRRDAGRRDTVVIQEAVKRDGDARQRAAGPEARAERALRRRGPEDRRAGARSPASCIRPAELGLHRLARHRRSARDAQGCASRFSPPATSSRRSARR